MKEGYVIRVIRTVSYEIEGFFSERGLRNSKNKELSKWPKTNFDDIKTFISHKNNSITKKKTPNGAKISIFIYNFVTLN